MYSIRLDVTLVGSLAELDAMDSALLIARTEAALVGAAFAFPGSVTEIGHRVEQRLRNLLFEGVPEPALAGRIAAAFQEELSWVDWVTWPIRVWPPVDGGNEFVVTIPGEIVRYLFVTTRLLYSPPQKRRSHWEPPEW